MAEEIINGDSLWSFNYFKFGLTFKIEKIVGKLFWIISLTKI